MVTLWFGLGTIAGETSAAKLHLAVAANTVDTVASELVVREGAYRRLGIALEIRRNPAERALRLANSGKVAGDVQRIDNLTPKYPNLIQLRPAINYIEATAFTRDKAISVAGWQGLTAYRIGLIRGIKFAERNTQGMQTYAAKNYIGLFRMLRAKRVDVVISPSLNGGYQLAMLGVQGVLELTPPLQRFDLFHYLHKEHADLVPKLRAIFGEMDERGHLARIRDHVISVLLSRARDKLGVCEDYACLEAGLDVVGGK